MKEDLKELSNEDLVSIYHLVLEHQEFLEKEKEKLMEETDEGNTAEPV